MRKKLRRMTTEVGGGGGVKGERILGGGIGREEEEGREGRPPQGKY